MSVLESSHQAPPLWRSTADDDSTLLDDLDHEPKVLKWYGDWDEWRRDLQPFVDVFIWRYMWSESGSEADDLPSCPVPPQVQQFNSQARDVSELTRDEFDRYHSQNKMYYSQKQEFDRRADMVDKTRALILRTVEPAKAEALDARLSLREWMAILKASTAPTHRQRIEMERVHYNNVLERFDLVEGGSGNGVEADWAHEWYSAVTRCHGLNLPETHCGTWLRDVADCILPYSPGLFERFMLGADRLDLAAIEWRSEAEAAIAFKTMHKCGSREDDSASISVEPHPQPFRDEDDKEAVELAAPTPSQEDRIWTFLEVYREIRDLDFAADVAPNDDDHASYKADDDAISPLCPACNLKGHELRHCWYAFEDRRPKGVMLSRSRLRRVERAIRTDKNLEQRVEDIYAAFTGGRFYQRQLMLGATQSTW
ncbi:hypothetical protein ACQKWADRAFT_121560 [Trichoderma austrokoningii]